VQVGSYLSNEGRVSGVSTPIILTVPVLPRLSRHHRWHGLRL